MSTDVDKLKKRLDELEKLLGKPQPETAVSGKPGIVDGVKD